MSNATRNFQNSKSSVFICGEHLVLFVASYHSYLSSIHQSFVLKLCRHTNRKPAQMQLFALKWSILPLPNIQERIAFKLLQDALWFGGWGRAYVCDGRIWWPFVGVFCCLWCVTVNDALTRVSCQFGLVLNNGRGKGWTSQVAYWNRSFINYIYKTSYVHVK